jgi:hypothetical protein
MYAGSSQVPQMRQSICDAAPKGQRNIVRILLRAINPVEKAADDEGLIGIRYFERVNVKGNTG